MTKAKEIALNGILGVFVLAALYLATIIPSNTLFFYGISSIFIAIVIIEHGVKAGLSFYLGTSLLAFIFLPDKLKLVPYVLLLGHYGIWKYYIELKLGLWQEILCKGLILNLGFLGVFFLMETIFLGELEIKFAFPLLVLFFQPVFILYDYVFSSCIKFYLTKIKPKLEN